MTKDLLESVHRIIISDETIMRFVEKGQVKAYASSENFDTSKPFVIIDPLGPPDSASYASNTELAQRVIYQINVEGPSRKDVKRIQQLIKSAFATKKIRQIAGGLDEYFPETKRYVDARRYSVQTKLYDSGY
ncbi:hypothetical protein [Enterococcus sp.]|uniref:hypothetical protein n=1 Tax=Enterococcus sp. TaxID=35783 RepID=UPI003C74DB1F